jgi:hypothetical protein
MPDRHYNSDEGEFVDFATLEDWEARDKAKDRQIAALAAERDAALARAERAEAAAKAARIEGARLALKAAAKAVSDIKDERCVSCGHPRSNHPYRHPFVGRQMLNEGIILALDPAHIVGG